MRFLCFLLSAFALTLPFSHADTYLNFPRASNNRLDEQNRDRDNGNRLFDSQNNNRGGYNVGSSGKPYYYEGTVIPMQWTVQHACNQPHVHCEMIVQYTCDDMMRDGTTTQTIPEGKDDRCTGDDCDDDFKFGRHESVMDYRACRWRTRNKGLFTADRNLKGNSARFTLQNENGDRRGLECPEERDYYPYWQPTIWRDIAILTDHTERCNNYRKESQNVKGRGYCAPVDPTQKYDEGSIPIDSEACGRNPRFIWKVQRAFGLPEPACLLNAPSRDNHHGNTLGGWPFGFNWTVPQEAIGENCVIRIRYNMTSGDFPYGGFGGPGAGEDWSSVQVGQLTAGDNRAKKDKSPAEFQVWLKYNLTRDDVGNSFGQKAAPGTFGYGKRGYVWEQNPVVDIFGRLLDQIPDKDNNGQTVPPVRLRLAINTNQYFRTFEDRTHIMAFRKRPQQLKDVKIHNLGVRGKRGNIVQVYPAVEYDFVPNKLDIQQGELIHIQWVGADTNPKNNDGSAHTKAGTDRHNVILLANRSYYELGIEDKMISDRGAYGRAYPGRLDSDDRYAFLGLDREDLIKLAFYGINSSYFDLGPRQVTRPGTYYYLATTNNNFSNRDQKARIVVSASNEKRETIEWGKEGTMLRTPSGSAWISKSEWTANGDFTPSTTQEMYVEQVPSGDGYASDWIHVHPDGPLAVPTGAQLTLTVEQRKAALQDGVIYWAATPDDSKLMELYEVQPTSGDLQVNINQGGYYVVKHRLNSAVLGGILIAIIFFVFVTSYLYYKIRIQPVGWSMWWSGLQVKKGGKEDAIPMQETKELNSKKLPSSSVISTNTTAAGSQTGQFAEPKVQQFTANYQLGAAAQV